MTHELLVPIDVYHKLISMFNLDKIVDFIKNDELVTVENYTPKDYKDVKTKQSSKTSTYTTAEYYDLLGLSQIVKACLPPITYLIDYVVMSRDNKSKVVNIRKYGFNILTSSALITQSAPYIKLMEKTVESIENKKAVSTKQAWSTIMENLTNVLQTGDIELPEAIISSIFFNTIALATPELDSGPTVVTTIHEKTKTALDPKGKYAPNKIVAKNKMSSDDSSSEMSLLEAFTSRSETNLGEIIAMENGVEQLFLNHTLFYRGNIETFEHWFNFVNQYFDKISETSIPETSIDIIALVMKKHCNVRNMLRLSGESKSIQKLMVLTASYLFANDFGDLAILLMSYYNPVKTESMLHVGAISSLSSELSDRIKELHPYEYQHQKKENNMMLMNLQDIVNGLKSNDVVSIFDKEIIERFDYTKHIKPHKNIKNRLAKLIIFIEESN
jgi:hypothetical protein